MLQSTVNANIAAGIPGELAFDSPKRASPGQIDPAALAANCVIGRYFTKNRDTGLYAPGGNTATNNDLVFGGILGSPKEHVGIGALGDPFAPTLAIQPGSIGTFFEMCMIFVISPAPCQEGDIAIYNTTTGVISFLSRETAVPAGSLQIPNAVVHRVAAVAAGDVACIKLTN